MVTTDPDASKERRELVISRVLDAPRDAVYRAWTEPDLPVRRFAPAP